VSGDRSMHLAEPPLQPQIDGTQYIFGSYCLRPDGVLVRNAEAVPLPPKELAALRLLLAHAGQIVSIEQLRRGVWGETHVSTDSLPRCISSLRARLKSQDCIQTIYKHGYRFNMLVKPVHIDTCGEERKERRVLSRTGLPRVAILPFLLGDGVPESLSAGIAEEIMLQLSRAQNPIIDVMARDSVFTLAATGLGAQQIGNTLQADLALTGTITALPLHLRLRAEMIRTADGVQLWVEDFLVPLGLLAYTDVRMAKRITARIRDSFVGPTTPVTAKSDAGLAELESRRSEAYSAYMTAKHKWKSLERHQIQDAVRGFQHALELDSTLLSARVHLMHSYLSHSAFGYMRADMAAELARKQAEITLSFAQGGKSVHLALGWIYFHHDRNLAAANAAFGNPQNQGHDTWNLLYRTRFALGQCRFAEAIGLLRAAEEIDSYSPMVHSRLIWTLHLSGERVATLKQAEHALRLFPDHPWVLFFASIVLANSSKPGGELSARATTLASRLIQIAPSFDAAYATLAFTLARQRRTSEARAVLERQQWLCRERFVMRSFHAAARVELGDHDEAIEDLTLAEQQHCPWIFELVSDPRLQPLHGNPVFQELASIPSKMQSACASVA
jgi:DNA-binding winged helix-turn-helix (wHTH) protein/tetratricopeptide (TPR) repeat protein